MMPNIWTVVYINWNIYLFGLLRCCVLEPTWILYYKIEIDLKEHSAYKNINIIQKQYFYFIIPSLMKEDIYIFYM